VKGWKRGIGWGWVWGKDDEVGSLNAMTDASRAAALRLAQQGKVLTVGTLNAGTKRNIIPDQATFEATVRSFDPAVRATIAAMAERVCHGISTAHGVEADVEFRGEYPLTVNDPEQTRFALHVATDLFGPGTALSLPHPITGSEYFSRVLAEVPGAMIFLGALVDGHTPGTAPSNHSSRAAFDDQVLPLGAALYAELATRRLS
jgi:hippurate hydrolase